MTQMKKKLLFSQQSTACICVSWSWLIPLKKCDGKATWPSYRVVVFTSNWFSTYMNDVNLDYMKDR